MASNPGECNGKNPSLVGRVLASGRTLGGRFGEGLGSGAEKLLTLNSTDNNFLGKAGRDVGAFMGGGGLLGYAYCKWGSKLFGGSCSEPPSKADIEMNNSIVSTALYQTILSCKDSSVSKQTLQAVCSSPTFNTQNAGCVSCQRARESLWANREQLQLDWLKISGSTTPLPGADAEVEALWADFEPCKYACQNCADSSIVQTGNVRATVGCVGSSTFNDEFRARLKEASSQAVANVSDVTGDLARLFSAETNCMVSSLTNRVNEAITDNQLDRLKQKVSDNQTINVTGNSIYMARVAQGISTSSISTFTAEVDVTSKMYTTEELDASQTLLDKNETVQDLAEDLVVSIGGFSSIFQQSIGKLIILLAIVATGVVLAVILFVAAEPELAAMLVGIK